MSAELPRSEAELLEREARLAREALSTLAAEITDSLARAADPAAWAKRYPWASVGAAAAGGVAAGAAVGSVTSAPKPAPAKVELPPTDGEPVQVEIQSASAAKSTGRIASGLGALMSAAFSAATVAATQAITDIVKTSIHEVMNPPPPDSPTAPPPT